MCILLQVKNLEIMGAPQPQAVMSASAKQVLRRLDQIDDKLLTFFQPAAKLVMAQSDPEDALCRALASMSGLTEVPKPRRSSPPPCLSLSAPHTTAIAKDA